MLKLVFFAALVSVAIAAPAPFGQLLFTARTDSLPIVQPANVSYPELKTIDAGYIANQYLGRIYGLVSLPSSSTTRQTTSPTSQPIVYTGYSAPLKYVGFPSVLDYISYVAKPWTSSNNHNNHGYGYQGQGYGTGHHHDDDDDDDDDDHGGWGSWGPWNGWGSGSNGGWGNGGSGQNGWGHHDDHDHNHEGNDKPGGTRPNIVNQIITSV